LFMKYGFSLVPIKRNDKIPVEKEWTNKEHKDKKEWLEWLGNGLNLGVRTGKISNLIIIDIDQKPIPLEIEKLMGKTLIQESGKGFHLYYFAEEELPKTRIDTLKIDIENEGGQVVIYPSVINLIQRKFINNNSIIKIPEEFKNYLKKFITVKNLKSHSEKLAEEIKTETYKKSLMEEGDGRHDYLFHLGCILRKQMNVADVEFTLGAFNKVSCSPPLEYKEMRNIINSINQYQMFDEKELANQILEYLKEVDEATHRDIERISAGDGRLSKEEKSRIDKALAFLLREDYLQKKGNVYFPIKKLDWKTDLIEGTKPLPFKIPYFYDLGYFCWGDVLVIGAHTGSGKTHVAMNIIKQLSIQGVKPYYVSLETGSRFKKIGLQLGLTEKDFYHAFCYDPTKIELEKQAITIIDWLNPTQFKDTHLTFGHFAQQLDKHGGLLIIFVQLKEDGAFFAPNLINLFPALSVKYFYDKDSDGASGYFEVNKIRESIKAKRLVKIPCKFNWDDKTLIRVDETKVEEKPLTEENLSNGNEEEKND